MVGMVDTYLDSYTTISELMSEVWLTSHDFVEVAVVTLPRFDLQGILGRQALDGGQTGNNPLARLTGIYPER